MHFIDNEQVGNISMHFVGNRLEEDRLTITDSPLDLEEDIKTLLTTYFLSSFKTEVIYHFHHDAAIELNEVYSFASAIFEDSSVLHEQSIHLAKHLYNQSNHPKIKGGELYIVYFKDCLIDGDQTDAIGIFKSENKETFLKILLEQKSYDIQSEKGLNLSKLDKGCIIFNVAAADGFKIKVVDNTNKSGEAQYWIDEFLHIRQSQDKYYNTEATLSVYKDFVVNKLPTEYEMNKVEQVDFLNRSMSYFKENENFDTEEFNNEVLQHPAYIQSFNNYKQQYEIENEVQIADQFDISEEAVKKSSKFYKSIIKLDKNFHIYVHGNKERIEQGEDENGKFYKLYYDEES